MVSDLFAIRRVARCLSRRAFDRAARDASPRERGVEHTLPFALRAPAAALCGTVQKPRLETVRESLLYSPTLRGELFVVKFGQEGRCSLITFA